MDMKYIETLREGMHVACVYLCKNKQIALTKNGKEYGNLVLLAGRLDSVSRHFSCLLL